MRTAFHAVLPVHHFRWIVKKVNLICEANFPQWNLYALKWNASTILLTSQTSRMSLWQSMYIFSLWSNDLYLSWKKPSCLSRSRTRLAGMGRYLQNPWKCGKINHFKDSFCIANRKTQNEKTLHADLLLAGITQLVTVLVADKIHQHQ